MRPAVSNIAWPAADDEVAIAFLKDAGVGDIEIAPTRRWPDLARVNEAEARTYAEDLHARGFRICAFQALLFGKPELTIFGSDDGKACLNYLAKVCRLARWMGAKALVFGSPKNRLRGSMPVSEAMLKAREFFKAAGDAAAEEGVVLCIEPNPDIYGCDFLQRAAETAELVREVNSPGIRMNLDMGELIHHGTEAGKAVREFLPCAGHFHASEPMLAPFDPSREAHRAASAALREAGYVGVVSLEMKMPDGGLTVLKQALLDMLSVYFSAAS